MGAVSSKALVLMLAVGVAGGGSAWGFRWLRDRDEKHAAIAAFESFYWKLQKGDLEAARALSLPGSAAERALDSPQAGPAEGVARGFALDVEHRSDGDLDGRPAVRITGHATVTVDPAGQLSVFGTLVPHEVDARLVDDHGTWRVTSFRDQIAPQ